MERKNIGWVSEIGRHWRNIFDFLIQKNFEFRIKSRILKIYILLKIWKHHNTHWLIQHTFINAILNRFGRLDAKNPTFNDELRLELITNNPFIIETDIAEGLFEQNHFMYWKKRSSAIWKELHYDDPSILTLFPYMNSADLHKLTGGPYQLRKAKAYVQDWIQYMKARKNTRPNQSESQSRTATYVTINTNLTMKIEKLTASYLNQHYAQFDSCIRCDIPSFYSRYRKYKIVILTKKVGRGAKYSFGCTCNTGLRSTPCAHGVLLIYLYANYFRDNGF